MNCQGIQSLLANDSAHGGSLEAAIRSSILFQAVRASNGPQIQAFGAALMLAFFLVTSELTEGIAIRMWCLGGMVLFISSYLFCIHLLILRKQCIAQTGVDGSRKTSRETPRKSGSKETSRKSSRENKQKRTDGAPVGNHILEEHPPQYMYLEEDVAKGVSEERQNAKGVSEDRQNAKGVTEERQNAKGVSEERQNAKGVSAERKNSKGTSEERKTSKGMHEERKTSKGASEKRKSSKGVPEKRKKSEEFPEKRKSSKGVEERRAPPDIVVDSVWREEVAENQLAQQEEEGLTGQNDDGAGDIVPLEETTT